IPLKDYILIPGSTIFFNYEFITCCRMAKVFRGHPYSAAEECSADCKESPSQELVPDESSCIEQEAKEVFPG
ncbi:MAG: hypothetical protein ACWGNV_11455, partial [Bacteroidales bacterium]